MTAPAAPAPNHAAPPNQRLRSDRTLQNLI